MSVATESPAQALRRLAAAAPGPPAEPYRNLEPFRFADAGILAARDREVERLVRLITMYRGVLLYGASGVGKTSVVNAGLLPRMLAEGLWPHRVRVAPRRGQELVLEAIGAADDGRDAFLPSAFSGADEHGRLVVSAGQFPRAVSAATEQGAILLVFDQFEELVTLFPHTAELRQAQDDIVQAIVTLLRGGAVEPGHDPREPRAMLPVKLLFSFREDYLAGLRLLLDAQPELVHQSLRLLPPPRSATTEIIRAPFVAFPGHYPRELSDAVATQIAVALADESDGDDLPLSELQIVCGRLWHDPDPSALLARRHVSGLVEDHLQDAVSKFEGEDRDAAIAVLSQLVTSSNTRNIVARADLVQRAHEMSTGLDPARIDAVIGRLDGESGLIESERRYDLDLYQITSEFLIPWISRQRAELAAVRERRVQEARLRRQQRLTAGVLGILVVIAVCAVLAVIEAVHAHHEQSVARTAQRQAVAQGRLAVAQGRRATDLGLATTAQTLLGARPDASLILALDAFGNDPGSDVAQTSIIAALTQAQRSGVTGILHGFGNTVTSVAFDPATGVLGSGSADGTIRLWNARTNTQVGAFAVPGDDGGIYSLAFSPDGRWLAAGGQSGTVWLWRVAAPGAPVWRQNFGQGQVNSIAFSPDGRWLAAAGLDRGIEMVRLSGGTPVGPLLGFDGASSVRSIAFSPDSQSLVSAGNDHLFARWRVATRRLDAALLEPAALYTVAFRPHTDEAFAGSLDGQIYAWNPADGAQATLADGAGPAINSIAFSPNGQTLAAGNAGDVVRLWNVAGRRVIGPALTGPEGIVTSVAFSPSGATLAAGSTDQTVQLWPIPVGNAFGSALTTGLGRVDSVAFGPGGRFAAGGRLIRLWSRSAGGLPSGATVDRTPPTERSIRTLAFDPVTGALASGHGGTVQLWSPSGRRVGAAIPDGRALVFSVAFSPDGRWLAAGGQGPIRVWRLVDGRPAGRPAQLGAGHDYSVTFSPDSGLLAAAGEDRTIRVWSIPSERLVDTLSGDSDAVFSLAFNDQGTLLASGSADDTVRLWNVHTGAEQGQALIGSHGYVRSVAFNPQGTILASGSDDGTIRLWNVRSGSAIGEPLSVNSSSIESVAFTPSGSDVVSGGVDGAVRTWPVPQLRLGPLRSTVCRLLGTGLSRAEWLQAATALPYEDPCGR